MIFPSGVPSPIFTPAVLQNELPPWAHPTPSPSPMIRCPPEPTVSEPDNEYAGSNYGDEQQSGMVTPVPDVLWEACRPFVQSMLQALHQVMQQEIQSQVEAALRAQAEREGHYAGASGLAGSGVTRQSAFPTVEEEGGESGSAFPSLLNSAVSSERHDRMGRPVGSQQPLREEDEDMYNNEEANYDSQKVVGSNSSGWSSKGSSPNLQGPDPPVQPVNRGDGVRQNATSLKAAATGAYASEAKPMYLTRQEPLNQPGSGSRHTPTVSPLIPMTEPSRYSPLISTTEPAALNSEDGTGSNSGLEKSVMVCRHWKSKGWCKLGDACKFLHLEHKRGTGIPPKKGGANGDEASPTADGEGHATTSRTRRAGRKNRRGVASAAAGGGAAAPTPSTGGDPSPRSSAPAAMAPGLIGSYS